MPTKHEIEVVITPDGQVRLDVKGMKGPACLKNIKEIAAAVGELKQSDLKSEYYEREQTGKQDQKRA
jgi:hypothetical protein